MDQQRPNILYIHSHDTGRYVQPYGHAVSTPRYQRLAEEGVLFRQAFCAAPTCSPSRAALLTGQCAHSSGMLGLCHRGFRLSDPDQHLLHTLKAAGYQTALAGVQHVFAEGNLAEAGYDFVRPAKADPEVVGAAYLREAAASGQPFFLDVGFQETHRMATGFGGKVNAPAELDGRYVRPPAPLPDAPETRRDMADYAAAAARLDSKVGVVLGALEESGLADNTLVILTTDHGIAFPRMKCSLTDHGIGVLLILRGPNGFSGGKVVDALVSQVDLYPTICEVAGVSRPDWLQGSSLLPLVQGQQTEVRDEVFAEVTFHAAFEPKRAVRTRRWKYIRNWNKRGRPVLPNCDDSLTKDLLLAHGWADRPVPEEELYDLLLDPNEADNRAGDSDCAAVLEEMRGRLRRWMEGTNDPVLLPELPVPEGVAVNPSDGLSPNEPVSDWPAERRREGV
jgi:arylsulfatase A-like enzyme